MAEPSVHVEERNGKRRVLVSGGAFIARREWETAYPIDLIEHVLRVKGPVWLNDEIRRDEDPSTTQSFIRWNVLSYADSRDFAGRRLLDFGSGCGASSMVLARALPETEIVGVELLSDSVTLARHRAEYYGVDDRVRFVLSADANKLPAGIGNFDYVALSGVWEHLLPTERRRLLPLIWSKLKAGGVLFIFETPHRWFPIESRTTLLPFINYLPDRKDRASAYAFMQRTVARFDHYLLGRAGWGCVRTYISKAYGYSLAQVTPTAGPNRARTVLPLQGKRHRRPRIRTRPGGWGSPSHRKTTPQPDDKRVLDKLLEDLR